MNKILKNRKSSPSTNETWDGEFKSEAPKWAERLIREESVDSDWEWGKVIPIWRSHKFETCNVN